MRLDRKGLNLRDGCIRCAVSATDAAWLRVKMFTTEVI